MSIWSSIYTIDDDDHIGFFDVARSGLRPDKLRIIVANEDIELDCADVFELRNVLTKWIRDWLRDACDDSVP